jgi:hypothetical protein
VLDAPVRRERPVPDVFEGLPDAFHKNFLQEPAFETEHSTFCIWRLAGDERWSTGKVELPPGKDPDGSAEVLSILDGDPRQYVEFAADYYERELDVGDVAAVYQHEPLSAALVKRLNPEVDIGDLTGDIAEVGYPESPA